MTGFSQLETSTIHRKRTTSRKVRSEERAGEDISLILVRETTVKRKDESFFSRKEVQKRCVMRPSFWILSTGTELAQGRSRDTNSAEIARKLADLGFDVIGISILPDDPEIILAYLQWLQSRNDVTALIMTGGLGPTSDDHTIDVLGRWTGSALIEDPTALRRLEAFARLRRRIDIETARRQVRVLADADVIPNNTGLAPGVLGSVARETQPLWYCALPGVPSEMRPMCDMAIDRLREKIHATPVHRVEFHVYEEPESDFQKTVFNDGGLAADALKSDPAFRWGVAAMPGSLKAFFEHETDERVITELQQAVQSHYGERFLHRSVEELLPEWLLEKGITVSFAESCTGGLLAKTITDRAGSSAYFAGSAVTYSNQSKQDLLSVPEGILTTFGAVSEECALAMADGALKAFHADAAVSVTGIAGPDGGTPEKPVGTVYSAIVTANERIAFKLFYPMDRERVREYTTRSILFRLYRFLQKRTGS